MNNDNLDGLNPRRNQSRSFFSRFQYIALILAVIGLAYWQGPGRIKNTWIHIYNSFLVANLGDKINLTPLKVTTTPKEELENPDDLLNLNQREEALPNQTMTPPGKADETPFAIHKQVQNHQHIVRYKDAQGKIHYADSIPTRQDITILSHIQKPIYKKPFIPLIQTIEYQIPVDLEQDVELATLKIYELFDRRLNISSSKQLTLNIKIFGDRNTFETYRNLKAPRLEHATGFYLGNENEAALWKHQSPTQLLSVLTHEASHAILHHKIGRAPAWIQEGFAEYFDQLKIYGQTIAIPLDKGWQMRLIEGSKRGTLSSLDTFFMMDDYRFYKESGPEALNYAMAWSLIYYWMETNRGRAFLNALLLSYKKGVSPGSVSPALKQFYPSGYDILEKKWLTWLHRPRVSHQY